MQFFCGAKKKTHKEEFWKRGGGKKKRCRADLTAEEKKATEEEDGRGVWKGAEFGKDDDRLLIRTPLKSIGQSGEWGGGTLTRTHGEKNETGFGKGAPVDDRRRLWALAPPTPVWRRRRGGGGGGGPPIADGQKLRGEDGL